MHPNGFHVALHRLLNVENKILMLGGYAYDHTYRAVYLDTIYEYNMMKDKWAESGIKLPMKMCSFGCLSAINDQCILIFGGADIYKWNDGYDLDI